MTTEEVCGTNVEEVFRSTTTNDSCETKTKNYDAKGMFNENIGSPMNANGISKVICVITHIILAFEIGWW